MRGAEAVNHGPGIALAHRLTQKPQGKTSAERAHDRHRVIARTVFGDHEADLQSSALMRRGVELLEGAANGCPFIVYGEDDVDLWIQRASLLERSIRSFSRFPNPVSA